MNSCTNKNPNFLDFSISYFKDLDQKETINSISEKKLITLESPNMGFENGVYWFKVTLLEKTIDTSIVFDFPESKINNVIIYRNSKRLPYQELDNTHRSLLVDFQPQNTIYFFKAHFDKEVFFPLKIKTYSVSQLNEKYKFFINGAYYGFVIMVLIINVFFYFSLKDKTFLFYCFFLIAVTLVILNYDGLFNTILPSSFLAYHILLIHFLVPFFGALFANQFLNIRYYIPKSNKIGLFLLFVTMCSYLLFISTDAYVFIAIGDTFSLLVLLHYWIIGVIILKKHEFAKFFVLGYSLILFSSFFFIIRMDWGLNTFVVSLNTIKFGALFEMLILTYAITHRVNILQKENEKFKNEIQEYLNKINSLENNTPIETNIEHLISQHNLSDREGDVLLLIFKGYTNQRIGDELFISLNTVKYHIRNIYEKLNINSKNEAIDMYSKIKTE
jgi:DNA-binding CsgD family transcriptional regulator